MTYPDGDALVPGAFDEHTIVLLVRPPDAPLVSEEELDRLQVEHLTCLHDLQRCGLMVANGRLEEQTDERLRGVSNYSVPLAEALELAKADPMVQAGRLAIDGARWWIRGGDPPLRLKRLLRFRRLRAVHTSARQRL